MSPSQVGSDCCLPKSHLAQPQRDRGRDGVGRRAEGDISPSTKTASWGQSKSQGPRSVPTPGMPLSYPQFPRPYVKGLR